MTGFVKRFATPVRAAEAIRRSKALCQAGIPTPGASPGPDPFCVVFARVDGPYGLRLADRPTIRLLRPLCRLHGAQLSGVRPFDPLTRIRPRIRLLSDPGLEQAMQHHARIAPRGGALLHGDFHLGQLIEDEARQVWVIDLDDLCLGPPEADLANLIANLATQNKLGGGLACRLAYWRNAVMTAWNKLGPVLDAASVDTFLVLALIRRHLKLREIGREDFEPEISRIVTGAEGRISPSGTAKCRD